ncbi:MAG: hypothetical protein KJ793_02470 [Candidatus Omnitrophica bacterium]|nr:hypothetical protein [Candidatus Omnitrophota bacterium]
MKKRELPKKESLKDLESLPAQKSGYSGGRISAIIKFILGICILPFVYSGTVSFINEFALIAKPLRGYFVGGIISFVVIYFFVSEPTFIYRRGFRLIQLVFRFFSPLIKVAPYLLPIYAIIVFVVYMSASFIFQTDRLISVFLFLFGFSLTLHLVFSAKSVRSKQGDFLKANYIFGLSFVYLVNLVLLSACFNFVFKKFSFLSFTNNAFLLAKNIFYLVARQLFL